MKKSIQATFFVIVFTLMFNSLYSQWQNIGPYGADVRGIVQKGNNLFCATYGYGLYKSTNGGLNWSFFTNDLTGLGKILQCLTLKDNDIYLGTLNGIYKSTNDGNNWLHIYNGVPDSQPSVYTIFVNGNDIYAGVFLIGVIKSTNNGLSWNTINNGINLFNGAMIKSIKYSNGYLYTTTCGYNGIYRSSNGGTNWVNIGTSQINSFDLATIDNYLFAFSDNGPYPGVHYSTNNGTNWIRCGDTLAQYSSDPFGVKDNLLYAVSGQYGVVVSSNYGVNWSRAGERIYPQTFYTNGTELFAGTGSKMYKSTNNGNNWINIINGIGGLMQINAVTYSGNNIIVGPRYSGLYYSSNYGISWDTCSWYIPPEDSVRGSNFYCFAKSGNYDFAGTGGWGILRSSDNGIHWYQFNNGFPDYHVYAMTSYNEKLFAVAQSSGIYASTDFGNNWTKISPGYTVRNGTAICYKDSTLFVGTLDSGVYKTTNFGLNWNHYLLGFTNAEITDIVSIGNNIFAGTWGKGVLKSTNGGVNWQFVNSYLGDSTINVLMSYNSYLFAGTYSGIYMSSNLGQSWVSRTNDIFNYYVFSLMVKDDYIYAGTGGSVYRRLFSDIIGVQNISTVVPVDYILFQNYPNPFNPSTVIKYSIPGNNFVSLKVYDVLGKEVAVLVNEFQKKGTYEVTFDNSEKTNLASGLYFYRITAGDYSKTKKMILLK
jgi:photosystem II stability/assembly factor-like uncharacterized protein